MRSCYDEEDHFYRNDLEIKLCGYTMTDGWISTIGFYSHLSIIQRAVRPLKWKFNIFSTLSAGKSCFHPAAFDRRSIISIIFIISSLSCCQNHFHSRIWRRRVSPMFFLPAFVELISPWLLFFKDWCFCFTPSLSRASNHHWCGGSAPPPLGSGLWAVSRLLSGGNIKAIG